jgi:metallo-beta-lactamase family protein
VERGRDHHRLLDVEGPAVIMAGSGMCTGGRIVDHLAQHLGDPATDVLFVGYQARSTPGRIILEHAGRPGASVRLDGRETSIKAVVHEIGGYSAHADQAGLAAWARAVRPGQVKLVHGDSGARRALGKKLGID